MQSKINHYLFLLPLYLVSLKKRKYNSCNLKHCLSKIESLCHSSCGRDNYKKKGISSKAASFITQVGKQNVFFGYSRIQLAQLALNYILYITNNGFCLLLHFFDCAWEKCDKELVNITNKHEFFKDQARYCVERQDPDLWVLVLAEQNEQRRSLIDQVVSTTLPSNLPNELIKLLERIVLSNSVDYNFCNNKNLQNLLIITAIKAGPTCVAGYVERLDNCVCISEQYKLHEEEFLIYKKLKKGLEATQVLLENLQILNKVLNLLNTGTNQKFG
ncbi:clathrin heavy chain, partial [Reticulomyxa filosa]